MEEILKILKLYELKNVDRMNSVKNRKESSAEHTFSSLILADYFLQFEDRVDRLKVYELVLYHDVVEIDAGDHALHPQINHDKKQSKELEAVTSLKTKIPKTLEHKFESLFLEFEEQKTIESRFATAIDKLDAIIQEIPYKQDWKGWSEDFLRKSKEKYFLEFPKIHSTFVVLLEYFKKEGYFDQ